MTQGQKKRWGQILTTLKNLKPRVWATKGNCSFVSGDCREALRHLPDNSIDCVITSPPYGQAKNYGPKGQIGFGQHIEDEYLQDIGAVLVELHRVSRAGAALWVVLDTVKRSGNTLLLPWEVITRAQNAGWIFQDLVIWDKGRSLPWSHAGHFRGVFEYILLLGKGKLKHFDLKKVREIDHLSSYWVKYPERFNPEGKAPSDLWHFPIPVQGSWSRNGIRHYCPFPTPMIARMISLTTRPGDTVLDPFAGTGTVPAVASILDRHGIGIDLNDKFVREFERGGYESLKEILKPQSNEAGKINKKNGLRTHIVRLRMLKYPRTLFAELSRPDRLGKHARRYIHAFVVDGKPLRSHLSKTNNHGSVGQITVFVLACDGANLVRLRQVIDELIRIPPLSKFGLRSNVRVLSARAWKSTQFSHKQPNCRWFLYTRGNFNNYESAMSQKIFISSLRELSLKNGWRVPPIFSPLMSDILPTIVG